MKRSEFVVLRLASKKELKVAQFRTQNESGGANGQA